MTTVYIAGPISGSHILNNVKKGMRVASAVMEAGMHFYLPHMMWHINRIFPKRYEAWMDEDFHWILKCDCLLRMPGDSPGADREVAFAIANGLPVFHALEDLIYWRDHDLKEV